MVRETVAYLDHKNRLHPTKKTAMQKDLEEALIVHGQYGWFLNTSNLEKITKETLESLMKEIYK